MGVIHNPRSIQDFLLSFIGRVKLQPQSFGTLDPDEKHVSRVHMNRTRSRDQPHCDKHASEGTVMTVFVRRVERKKASSGTSPAA